ncbi:MAG TPA: hypothetical protein VGM07_04065 [Stellaceae bacterium]|jgi:hypothetical protein
MKLIRLSQRQAETIVQAMAAVVSAEGQIAPEPIELDSIAAIQRHLLLQDPPLACVPGTLPEGLAAALDTQRLRRQTVRILAMLPILDRKILPEKVLVVEEAAERLGVREFGVVLLGRIARDQRRRLVFGLAMFGLMRRYLAHYQSLTGRARGCDWLHVLWSVAPWLPGLRKLLGLDELLAKYRGLAALPQGTLGHAVHCYYARKGFPLPGAPKSIPEGWGRHEVYHVLSDYNTNLQGELLVAGFIAGNSDELCLEVVLPALVHLHAGRKFVPGPVAEGKLRPDDFFRAVARGMTMSVDLLAGWRLWEAAAKNLAEVRANYNLPALSEDERSRLLAENALLA